MVTLSTSAGASVKDAETNSQKDSRNHAISITRKASVRTKKEHKTSFKVSSVAGTEDQAVRVITNPSDTDPMRVDYFQLMRKWRVDLYRYGLRLTYHIVVPSPGGDLLREIAEIRWIDRQSRRPFEFTKTLNDIKPDTYADVAQELGVSLSDDLAPPLPMS